MLHFSQVCRSWRTHSLANNVFAHHEKQLLLDNELILSSDELDTEYTMLERRFGPIDNIDFYLYIRRRVHAAIHKTHLFTRRLTHCFLGNKSLDKWTPPLVATRNGNDELAFKYEDAAIYEHLVAVGQPDGSITVVDLGNGELHAEFSVYDNAGDNFRWCDVLINCNYIVCSSTLAHHQVMIVTHSGQLLTRLPHGRPYMISDHKVLILSERENRAAYINLYDLSECVDVNEKLKSHAKIKVRTRSWYGVDHFCANESIVVVSVESREEVHIYSLESQSLVASIDTYQPHFATAGTHDCVNYWFDVFEHESNTYLAALAGGLKVWKIDERGARSDVYELVNEFQIQPSCRITVKAENRILAISLNDIHDADHANNSIYAIPYDVLVNRRDCQITDVRRQSGYESVMINPICVFEDMITSGISVSKSRIALLHCNGSISDLVSFFSTFHADLLFVELQRHK